MDFRFTKMQGCGNDFIVADDRGEDWDFDPQAIELLCDRHFGVGADGLILVRKADDASAGHRMVYYNADGSSAEICGNGMRVFAKFIADRGLIDGDSVRVQTPCGVKAIEVSRGADGAVVLARVDMGGPALDAEKVPTTLRGAPVVDALLHTEAGDAYVTCVSMGNPHAVIWVDDTDLAPVASLGPLIERHRAFPRGTNVEFAQVVDRDHVRLRVWERGVGETLACGSGACATVVAGALAGRLDRAATVELPGGELFVEWTEAGPVMMTGPAEQVFEGSWPIHDE
jgi:diaminopimelate epimerase